MLWFTVGCVKSQPLQNQDQERTSSVASGRIATWRASPFKMYLGQSYWMLFALNMKMLFTRSKTQIEGNITILKPQGVWTHCPLSSTWPKAVYNADLKTSVQIRSLRNLLPVFWSFDRKTAHILVQEMTDLFTWHWWVNKFESTTNVLLISRTPRIWIERSE